MKNYTALDRNKQLVHDIECGAPAHIIDQIRRHFDDGSDTHKIINSLCVHGEHMNTIITALKTGIAVAEKSMAQAQDDLHRFKGE